MMTRLLASLSVLFLCSCGPSDEGISDVAPASKINIPNQLIASDTLSGDNALYHAAQIVSFGERSPESPGHRKQLNYIKSQLAQYGWVCDEQAFRETTAIGDVAFINLRARYGDQREFDDAVKLLVSCHIDTKTRIPDFVGANDGASGAAVIIELARMLAKEPSIAQQIELVFFDGEESFAPSMSDSDGLYGSKYYVSLLKAPLPSFLINLDMVGRQGMKIRIPPSTPQDLYSAYRESIAELKLPRTSWGVAENEIYDDHIPFVRRGIPSINIIDDFGDGNWWHTSRDNLEILSAKSMQDSGNVALSMIRRLLE